MASCSWSSEQNLLATCSQDKVVQLWSVSHNSVELQTTFSCITRWCFFFCFSTDYFMIVLVFRYVLTHFKISLLWLSSVRWTGQTTRGQVGVTTCLPCTGVQGGTSWLPQRTNTSTSWTSGVGPFVFFTKIINILMFMLWKSFKVIIGENFPHTLMSGGAH